MAAPSADEYFLPQRRDEPIRFTPGVNYIPDQLSRSLQVPESKKLMLMIYHLRVTDKYQVIESSPGIGTTTIVVADELGRRVQRLQLIEDDASILPILENNLRLYGHQSGKWREAINIARRFDNVKEHYLGGVGIFHPTTSFRGSIPTLQPVAPNIPLTQQDIERYAERLLQQPIFLGPSNQPQITLPKLIDMIKDKLQLAFIITQRNFPVPYVGPDVAINLETMEDFQVMIVRTTAGQELARKIHGARETSLDFYGKRIKLKVEKVLAGINVTSELAGFMPINIPAYVTPEFMPIWIHAFTHKDFKFEVKAPETESVDPKKKISSDYESLEALGDSLLGAGWAMLLFDDYYPYITQAELNLAADKYMSKHYQPELSHQLKLANAALYIDGTNRRKLMEDLFESFTGALGMVAQRVDGKGVGLIRAYQLLTHMFWQKVPQLSDLQPEETRVKQALEALWFKWQPFTIDRTEDGSFMGVLSVSRSFVDFMQTEGIKLNSTVLGNGKGRTVHMARASMFNNALKNLTDNKITEVETRAMADKYRVITRTLNKGNDIANHMSLRKALHLYIQPIQPTGNVRKNILWEVVDYKGNKGKSSNVREKVAQVDVPINERGEELISRDQVVAALLNAYLTQPGRPEF